MHLSLLLGSKLMRKVLDLEILFGELSGNINIRCGVCRGSCCVITQRPKGMYHSWGLGSFCPGGDVDVLGELLNQQCRGVYYR